VFGSSLAAAFNGQEGTFALWLRVSGAGVWTDGVARRVVTLSSATEVVYIRRETVNNRIGFTYLAGGVTKTVPVDTLGGSLLWNHVAVTWSKAADQMKVYINGVQSGATQTGLGTWITTLAATTTVIGAGNTTPSSVWSGNLAHAAVWSTPLSAGQIATLAAVP
jgi:hypothetical protein